MTKKRHQYAVQVRWTGNSGTGTSSYRGYDRSHDIRAEGKPTVPGSADPAFLGSAARWNPEELLVASLAACHKLWFLALCAQAGVVVTAYEDFATGEMVEEEDGAGQFSSVVLKPHARLAANSNAATALRLHHQAHTMCFIARSVNFQVAVEPLISLDPLPEILGR